MAAFSTIFKIDVTFGLSQIFTPAMSSDILNNLCL